MNTERLIDRRSTSLQHYTPPSVEAKRQRIAALWAAFVADLAEGRP